MASEKQIAANRANAKKSTGPRSCAGRARSSQNAKSHGLSAKSPCSQLDHYKNLVEHMVGEAPSVEQLNAAFDCVSSALLLNRIDIMRRNLFRTLHSVDESIDIDRLFEIAALDRYERGALRKMLKAELLLRPIRE